MRLPPFSFQAGRALKAKAREGLQLFGEIEQLVFLAEASHELNTNRQSVVEPRRNRYCGHSGEADWKHELYVARPFIAEERRYFLDGHRLEAEGRRQEIVESCLQRYGDRAVGRLGGGFERVEVVHSRQGAALLGELPNARAHGVRARWKAGHAGAANNGIALRDGLRIPRNFSQ